MFNFNRYFRGNKMEEKIKELCSYDEQQLRRMKEQEIITILNNMTREAYDKDYFEVFGFDLEREEMIKIYDKLKIRIDVQEHEEPVPVGIPGKKNFIDIWSEIWDGRIISQDECKILYGLCAVSQLFNHIQIVKNVKDDVRIHLCVIMPTATGKSEGNTMLIEYCKRLSDTKIIQMTYATPGEYSPATLVGSFDKHINDANIASGQYENDPERYPDWRDPIKYGMLATSNFVIFDEAENILKTTPRTEGAQRILQETMNRYGSETNVVSNHIIAGKVEYNPSCNISMTSFYQDSFKETLLSRGLLQRTIIFYKSEDDVKRDEIQDFQINKMVEISNSESVADGLKKIGSINKREEELFDELNLEVKKLIARHAGTQYIMLRTGVKDRVKFHINELRDVIPNMSPYQKEVWETMISRITPSILKISAIYALIDYREVIEEKDVDNAAKILNQTMKSIAIFMLSKIPAFRATDGYNNLYNKLKVDYKHHKMTNGEWVDKIMVVAGISSESAKRKYSELKASKKIVPRMDIKTGETKFMLK